MNKTKVINRIREFNRFYTVWQGFLNKHFMNSEYSITETRVLFELKNNQPCSAKLISEKLNIDKSYLSRIINVFLSKQLITKEILPKDKRAFMIRLTENGLRIVDELIEKANYQIGCQIQNLSLNQCQEICTSLDIITKYFSDNGKESGSMEIIKYNPKYKNEFIQFNTDWIVEISDL